MSRPTLMDAAIAMKAKRAGYSTWSSWSYLTSADMKEAERLLV